MSNFKNIPKVCCLVCKKEFFVNMINKHIVACDKKNNTEIELFNSLILWEEYVSCGICNKLLLENNNAHLNSHNITPLEYDILYPNHPRLSKKGILNKNHFSSGITKELSEKLKHSHTISGYIEKYGEELGTQKYNLMIYNKSYSKTDDYYKETYGEDWQTIKKEHNLKKGITLEKYIKKYGEELGTQKYNKLQKKHKIKNTLAWYIEKYGELIGYLKWKDKNDKISIKNSKLDKNKCNNIDLYYNIIDRLTEHNYKIFKTEIDKNSIRSKEYHLDHRVSKCYGYINKIHPVYISSNYNLEIKTKHDNCKKQEDIDMCPNKLKNMVDLDDYYVDLFKQYDFTFE